MKEPLLDMGWNEDRDYDANCLNLSGSCLVAQRFFFFFLWFYGTLMNRSHPWIMLAYMTLLYLILKVLPV